MALTRRLSTPRRKSFLLESCNLQESRTRHVGDRAHRAASKEKKSLETSPLRRLLESLQTLKAAFGMLAATDMGKRHVNPPSPKLNFASELLLHSLQDGGLHVFGSEMPSQERSSTQSSWRLQGLSILASYLARPRETR